jgi:colanic acid biosynthesis glycosyl transferase WcaI
LQAAEHLQQEKDIQFVIVGEGVRKQALVHYSQEHELQNVLFLPFQPRKQFSDMMAAADVGFVTLNNASASFSLPSKTFNIMASARPILAVTPPDSEIAHLVKTWECGINVPVGQPVQLARTILKIRSSLGWLETAGQNGRKALEQYYSRQRCVPLYEATLQQAIQAA